VINYCINTLNFVALHYVPLVLFHLRNSYGFYVGSIRGIILKE
jgi:hypothetical protein